MAEMGDSGGGDGAKKDGREEVAKRGRGRPRKTAGGEAEAKMLKKFLESKEEVTIFGKSNKIQHTPEKGVERKQAQSEDGEEVSILTDGEAKTREGQGENMDSVNEKETEDGKESEGSEEADDDDRERDGREKRDEREGEATDDNKAGHSGQGEKKPRDENSGTKGGKEREEEKDSVIEGMSVCASELRVIRFLAAKMSELEIRIKELTVRVEEEERRSAEVEEKCRISNEVVKAMEKEIARLYELEKGDRLRIIELENRLEKIPAVRDENDNINGSEVNTMKAKVKEGANGGRGTGTGTNTTGTEEMGSSQRVENIDDNENSGGEGGGGEGYEDRNYLHCIPTRLGEGERVREMEEREIRKKNLMIRGIRTVGKGLKEEVKRVIKEQIGIEIYIKKVAAVEGGLLVELESFSNKIEIIKRKGKLRGINLWIQDDYTPREKEIQEWLGLVAEEEGKRGHEVKVSYQKIMVDGEWYKWDEKKGAIEPLDFQERKEKKTSK